MTPATVPRLRIEPRPGWRALDLRELWRYRELIWLFGKRDIQVRYKQTVLGVAWAVLQPLLTMSVFTVFFGYLGGMNQRLEGAIRYPLYAYCALLPWQLFAFVLSQSSNSVVAQRGLLTKVYFPRIIVPIAPIGCALLDFAVSAVVLAGMMFWFGNLPGGAVWTLPFFLALAIAAALGVGIWFAALNALYRDIQYTVPFLVQLWLFATPVAYPTSIVPARWRLLYGLNPMVGVVDGFRWALLGGHPPGRLLIVSTAATIVLLVGGIFFFRRMERTFADLV
jgi:lipopolysaccharide transport system permease protein